MVWLLLLLLRGRGSSRRQKPHRKIKVSWECKCCPEWATANHTKRCGRIQLFGPKRRCEKHFCEKQTTSRRALIWGAWNWRLCQCASYAFINRISYQQAVAWMEGLTLWMFSPALCSRADRSNKVAHEVDATLQYTSSLTNHSALFNGVTDHLALWFSHHMTLPLALQPAEQKVGMMAFTTLQWRTYCYVWRG